jgi:signal transduction histidine kinase
MRHRDGRNFSETDLAMAASFASHASIALELADSRAAEQKLVLLEDRDRIAMDLHDHVIQELFAIGLSLEGMAAQVSDSTADRLRQRVDDLDRTIRRIRTSIFELRGNWASTPGGMRQQVLEIASELTAALGFAPHVTFSGLVDLITEAKLAEDTSACIREMVSNVARHARATSAAIDVQRRGEALVVTVTDDGIGPPVAAPRRSGTANLAARAEKHGGSFEMTAASSGGTIATWKARIT